MEAAVEICTGSGEKTGKDLLSAAPGKENGNPALGDINGSDEIADPLDLLEHCENKSIGSNSDIWKNSDSEDESFDQKQAKIETEKKNTSIETPEKINVSENMNPVVNNPMEDLETCLEAHVLDKSMVHGLNPIMDQLQVEEPSVLSEKVQEVLKENGDDSKETTPEEITTEKESENKEQSATEDVAPAAVVPEELATEELVTKEVEKEPSVVEDSSVSIIESEAGTSTDCVEDAKDQTPEVNGDEADPEKVRSDSPEIVFDEQDPLSIADPLSGKNQPEINEESEMDYDDDFDPSLLCPEVTMAVDETPVLTDDYIVKTYENPPNAKRICTTPEPLPKTFHHEVTADLIEFNLSEEEEVFRKKFYGASNHIPYSKLHCTACNTHLGSALENQKNRFVHPLLKVLICKQCFDFYTSGDFEKDEDGSELYCRWCGQGGQVLCCSTCEFVFCKRCITTNLGRKQMLAIRDSDNWNCFRCAPSQIMRQRVSCYELFEYAHSAIMNSTIKRGTEEWKSDYSLCCLSKKRTAPPDHKRVKRAKKEDDEDYDPFKDNLDPTPKKVDVVQKNKELLIMKPQIQLVPKPRSLDSDIQFVKHIPAPQLVINPLKNSPGASNFRKILPNNQNPPALIRLNPAIVSSSTLMGNTRVTPAYQVVSSVPGRIMKTPTVKHEWFEKTVRSAARVNSNLNYTFTHLGKTLNQARGVEEMAGVHNKLQETLSTSINSLINIRKQLRTEFIAGIKTVQMPPKKPIVSNDDDVIIVGASTVPAPTTTTVKLPPHVFVVNNSKNATPKHKSFIKLKTVDEVNASVDSSDSCIVIQDEVSPKLPTLTPAPKPRSESLGAAIDVEICEKDPLEISCTEIPQTSQNGQIESLSESKKFTTLKPSSSIDGTANDKNDNSDADIELIPSDVESEIEPMKDSSKNPTNVSDSDGISCRKLIVKVERVDLLKLQKQLRENA